MPKIVKIALVAGGHLTSQLDATEFDYFVGIDRGSLFLLKNGLSLAMAIGDFDSVSQQEFEDIKAHADRLVRAKSEKNHTDTELALQEVFKVWPSAQVTLFAGLGGRLDHSLSNLFLPSEPSLAPFMSQISLDDGQNWVTFRPAGSHEILPRQDMTYVSFLPEGGRLTISGAKYPLNTSNFFSKKIYSSNEFLDSPIRLDLDKGYVIIIYSRDGR